MENNNENTKNQGKKVSVLNILILLTVSLILLYPTQIPTLFYLRVKDFIYPYTKEGRLRKAELNGSLALNNKEYEKAIENFNLAIKINPDDPQLYYLRGLSYEKMENFDKAIEDYTLALNLSTGATLYGVLVDTQIYTEALADVILKKGKEYYKKGNIEEAMKYYDRAVKLDSKLIIFTLPDFLEHVDKTIKELKKSEEEADRGQFEATSDLLLAYLYMGDCKSAQEEYKNLISKKIKEIGGEFYINIGTYLWKCKKNKYESLKYFEKGFQKGFNKFDELYSNDSYGRLIEGLNNQEEFKSLVRKYRNH